MAEASCPRASRYVLRLRGRFGSGHQGVRACGGLYRQYLAGPLADIHGLQVTCARLCLEAGREDHCGEKGHAASDAIGTLHFSHWVPFEDNHVGFFTIYDGDLDQYIQDFADKNLVRLRCALSTCRGRAATPSRKERPGVPSVGIGQQLSAHRVLQRLSRPLGSRHPSPAGRSQITVGHRSIAVDGHEPVIGSAWPGDHSSTARARGFFADCLVEGGVNAPRPMAIRGPERSALDLADIQGFILRGYRMPMVRHFLLTVANSGTGAQATWTARQRRRIRRPANHHCRGLARGVRARTGRQSRGCPASQARLLPQHRHHVARTGRAGDKRTRPERCRSSRLAPSPKEPRDERSWSEIPEPARPQNWIGGFGKGHDHVLVTLHAISPDAMTELQRPGVCLVCRRRCLSRNLAPGRDGVDGDARRPTRAYCARLTSDIPTASPGPPFAAARKDIPPITSSPASHGSSSCGKTLRTTRCRSRDSSA